MLREYYNFLQENFLNPPRNYWLILLPITLPADQWEAGKEGNKDDLAIAISFRPPLPTPHHVLPVLGILARSAH
jgi:hypothetical protein